MKTKIIKLTLVMIIFTTIALSFNSAQNKRKNQDTSFYQDKNELPKHDAVDINKKTENRYSIKCNGMIYSNYPSLNGFENKLFAENLNKIAKVEIKKSYYRIENEAFNDDIQEYLFSDFKNLEKHEGYSKYYSRIDGEKITWAPVAMLPTNGKFVMIIIVYWEKEAYEPSSKGFYLSTVSLKGKMLSMAYIYGYEEIDATIVTNTDKLSDIWGRAYCLNTNKPIIRKAVNWDSYIDRGGFIGTTLEVNEIQYSINEEGYIKIENEKIIFPRTQVQWKDRAKVTFETGSDTIRKMLGEIE